MAPVVLAELRPDFDTIPVVTVYRDPEHAVTCWIAGPAMACLRDEPGGDWHDEPAMWECGR